MALNIIGGSDKQTFKCDMCKTHISFGDQYHWEGIISKTTCDICIKCAKREFGTKNKMIFDEMLKKFKLEHKKRNENE